MKLLGKIEIIEGIYSDVIVNQSDLSDSDILLMDLNEDATEITMHLCNGNKIVFNYLQTKFNHVFTKHLSDAVNRWKWDYE